MTCLLGYEMSGKQPWRPFMVKASIGPKARRPEAPCNLNAGETSISYVRDSVTVKVNKAGQRKERSRQMVSEAVPYALALLVLAEVIIIIITRASVTFLGPSTSSSTSEPIQVVHSQAP